MKVRISYTVEVDQRARRAMRHYYGIRGLATRDQIHDWFWNFGRTMDNELDAIATQAETQDANAKAAESWRLGTHQKKKMRRRLT
jgi:hypothetical protein